MVSIYLVRPQTTFSGCSPHPLCPTRMKPPVSVRMFITSVGYMLGARMACLPEESGWQVLSTSPVLLLRTTGRQSVLLLDTVEICCQATYLVSRVSLESKPGHYQAVQLGVSWGQDVQPNYLAEAIQRFSSHHH